MVQKNPKRIEGGSQRKHLMNKGAKKKSFTPDNWLIVNAVRRQEVDVGPMA